MSLKNERCTECNGTGSVLKHMYGNSLNASSVNHGHGLVSCPRCYGRGYNQAYDSNTTSNSTSDFNEQCLELAIGWYTMFCVIAFVASAIYGLNLLGESTSPTAVKILSDYIGPNGYVSRNVFGLSIIAASLVIGIIFRKILRWIVPIGLVSWGIWAFL